MDAAGRPRRHPNAGNSWRRRHARWLRKQLAAPDGSGGKVRWYSIFKFKGLESDAIIITDVNPAAVAFADTHALNLPDMMYVGMTRAKYHCVVLDSAEVLAKQLA
ncbi:ATP-binding domain-containing protein [Glaciihabitans arcticus]|uniref:ATP-binding domain-containing protein n=1 Tax=Glaciihabitans arcticus TaxID=2668039 RepID=UPI0013871375|nr:ATP-binding domain-containing protein [Glaciihabitans arcticus]